MYIKDLNSSNGTFLNGTQLKGLQPALLQENDIIQFGTEDEDARKESVVIVQVQINNGHSNAQNAAGNSPPIYSKVHKRPDEPEINVQQRITDVMRRLSSLAMQTSCAKGSGKLEDRLAQLEDAVELCLGACGAGKDESLIDSQATIYTHPSLSAALRIIVSFLFVFNPSECL
jgi:FHA domain